MSNPPRRTSSLRHNLQKLTSVVRRAEHGDPPTPTSPLRHGCLSLEEDRALRQLNEELAQRHTTLPPEMIYAGDIDATLLRFLRARKYNIDATINMLTATIQWRRANGINDILHHPMEKWKVDNIRRYKPGSYIGFDREGRPIYVDRLSELNLKALLAANLVEDDAVKYHLQEMEYMGRVLLKEASERAGHTIDSVVIIMDVRGIGIADFTASVKSLVKRITSTDSDNYPETNAGTYVVNASFLFSAIWGIVQNFLDKRTRAKLSLLKAGKPTEQKLVEVFGAERVPTFLGGRLDYDTVSRAWMAKMDETMEELKRKAQQMAERREVRQLSVNHSAGNSHTDSMTAGHQPDSATAAAVFAKQIASSLSPLALEHATPHVAADSGFSSLPPAPGDQMMLDGEQFEDAEEFYTPRSSLSRTSSTTGADHINLEVNAELDAALAHLAQQPKSGSMTPTRMAPNGVAALSTAAAVAATAGNITPTGTSNGPPTPTAMAASKLAALVNVKERDVSPVLQPVRAGTPPTLEPIDERKVIRRPAPPPPRVPEREEQPQCRCCIQ